MRRCPPQGQTNQSTYFTTLALQIGQRLQAHNSYFYGKCLQSAVLNPDFTLGKQPRHTPAGALICLFWCWVVNADQLR